MANTPVNPKTDPVFEEARRNDPLRTRQGLTYVQYGTAFHGFKRAARSIPDRVLDWITAGAIGAALGILLACNL